MTTSAAVVAEQPTVAAKANLGRVREAGARGDGAAAPGEGEQGFGEVLSKLKGQGGQYAGETAVPNAGAGSGERTSVRWQEIEAQLAAADDGGNPSVGAVVDWLSGGGAPAGDPLDEGPAREAAGTDAPPAPAPAPGVIDATAIATIVAYNAADPSAAPGPDMPAAAPAPPAHPDAPTKAILERTSAPSGAQPPSEVESIAKDQLEPSDASSRLAPAMDAVLARSGARGTAAGKDKSEPADGVLKRAATAEPSLGDAIDKTPATQRHEPPAVKDPPKANVVRQETHFAPVAPAPAGPQATASAEDNAAKPATGPEARGAEAPTAAPSLEAALLPPDEATSFAAPPAQQIADSIVGEAGPAAALAERAGVIPDQPPGSRPALKIVHVQLQPAELGTVTVRMELKDAELTLQVESDRAETVDLIRSDQDTLARILRSAGYSIDTNSIRVVEGDRTAASQQVGQQGTQTSLQSSPQSQSGAWERQEHAQRGGTGDGDARPQTSRNETHETTTNRVGLGLYI